MKSFYGLLTDKALINRPPRAWCGGLVGLALLPLLARAQAPVITAVSPATATIASTRNTAVSVTFSQPLHAGSAAALQVISSQRGGVRTAAVPATVSGNTLTFSPGTYDFLPGEVVLGVVTTAAQNSLGIPLAAPRTFQFVAPALASPGTFNAKTDFSCTSTPYNIALGDVNGDGKLDILTANSATGFNSVSVLLGTGAGSFGTKMDFTVGAVPKDVELGDVNGDGRLDIVTANNGSTGAAGVSVLLNTSTSTNPGTFSTKTDFATGNAPINLALGDVNGDGKLDIVTANASANSVSVLLGTGTGSFGAKADFTVGTSPAYVALGDVNGDGNLDIATANMGNTGAAGTSVLLGTGTGSFGTKTDFATGSRPDGVALGDVNGDGRLDLVTANSGSTGVAGASVLLGTGATPLFNSKTDLTTASGPFNLALGDVNGDGKLDLVTANDGIASTISVLLGTGTGSFGTKTDFATGCYPAVALGDLNGDGRLDAATTNFSSTGPAAVSVLLGTLPVPAVSTLSTTSELPGQPVVLTGTGFTSSSTVTIGGVAATSVVYNSPTSLTVTVPVGAAVGNNSVVVTTGGGSSTGTFGFEVLQVYRSTGASSCLTTASASLTGGGGSGAWRYLRMGDATGAVVAAIEDTQNLGTVAAGFSLLGTNTSSRVRQDASKHYYLDRNFYLTATNKVFPGQSVRVRFYGLSSELTRLQAADANATAASLKASQYSGTNEDCDLSNNSAAGSSTLLAAPATIVSGADWFAAEVLVANHFSEFYLTGASQPLPVQLLEFAATAAPDQASVRLTWVTASETNSARFEVERSLDGVAFGRVGEAAASGTSLVRHSYALTDARLPVGTSLLYYRLRQVDQDGTSTYSPVRNVALGGASWRVYPNPAQGSSTVAGLTAGASVRVSDALGRLVAQATADAEGTAQLELPAGLAAGVYMVRSGTQTVRLSVE